MMRGDNVHYRDDNGVVWNEGHLRFNVTASVHVFGLVDELPDGQLAVLDETVRPLKPCFLIRYINTIGVATVVLFDGDCKRCSNVEYRYLRTSSGEYSTHLWLNGTVKLTRTDHEVLVKAVNEFMAGD
jgi:hypothetical protein